MPADGKKTPRGRARISPKPYSAPGGSDAVISRTTREFAAKQDRVNTTATRAKNQRAAVVGSMNADYVWVDGKRMRIVGFNPDGSMQITLDNGAPKPYNQPTAFDALDSGSLDPDAQFVMSIGTRRGPDGTTTLPTRSFDTPMSADAADRQHQRQVGANRMTVQSGVQWLAALSTKDPEAYAEMVDKLHDSGYLSDSDYAVAGGGFSTRVAAAFADAARDTAVVNANGTEAGANMTLNDMLASKKGANTGRSGADYTPVDRKFTDPAALAQTARAAAQDLLGRALTPDEEKRFTSKFRGLETGFYDQIDTAGRNKTGATVTDPNPSGQADTFVRAPEFDADRTRQLTGEYMDVLKQLFGGA